MRRAPVLLLFCLCGCAATSESRPPAAAPAQAAVPAAARLEPIHEAIRSAQAALAADQIEAALPEVRRAEQLIGLQRGAPTAQEHAAGLDMAEAEIEERLKPALRERIPVRFGERYGVRSPQQIEMVLDRGLPAAQLSIAPGAPSDRRCWRFDHEQGATLSCWSRDGALELELLSTPAVLKEVEGLAQQPGQLARDQVSVLLARGLPVERTSSPTRSCWIYGPPKGAAQKAGATQQLPAEQEGYEWFCWTTAKPPRLDHYEDVHPSLAFDPSILDKAATQYGARTPQRLRTLLSLGVPEAQRSLDNGQRCWLHREKAGDKGAERISLHCFNQAGQLFRYQPVHPQVLPDLERLGSKYDARSQVQIDLILELGPPLRTTRGDARCWIYRRDRYCFDAAGALVEHTVDG